MSRLPAQAAVASNRYLNLAGSPWSPDHPNRFTTRTLRTAVLVPPLVISLSVLFGDHARKDKDILMGGAGAVIGAVSVIGIRRLQRGLLNSDFPGYVIDMVPDRGARNSDLALAHGRSANFAMTYGATNIMLSPMSLGLLAHPFMAASQYSTPVAFMAAFGTVTALCQYERIQQFRKIIKDQAVLVPARQATLAYNLSQRDVS